MPVQIGAKAHSFSEPMGLLSDCHRRIAMFMSTLCAVADQLDAPEASEQVKRSLERALDYFHEAAPRHTADEEESLFPRLRSLGDPQVQAGLQELDKLESDHRWAEPLHSLVDRLGRAYLRDGKLTADEVRSFRDAVQRLNEMYLRHTRVEDELVFPLATKALPENQKQEIAREMAQRRQISEPVKL